ncbi:MAG: phenylalanine--tRNA ligase subunit alpha, partial [Vicinamibacterales bacterium]
MSSPIDPSIGHARALDLFREELAGVRTTTELQALRTRWVGRKGSWVATFMDALATATPEQKKAVGRGANELKKEVEAAIAGREAALASTKRPPNAVDITLPG